MKNKFRRICKYLFIVLVTVISIPIVTQAKTVNDQLIVDKSYTFYVATTKFSDPTVWHESPEYPMYRASDHSLVYCIQAHLLLTDGAYVTGYDNIQDKLNLSNLSREQVRRIELLAYYGYGYGNHSSLDWYAATQLLIWQVTDPVSTPYPITHGDETLSRSSYYDQMMQEINNLVATHGDTVSFNNYKIEMKTGETIRLNDKNKVLGNYFKVESNEVLDMKIEGNDLVIHANKGYEGQINLIAKSNNNVPLIYDGANQKAMSIGDPTYINGKISLTVLTEFQVNKVYGDSEGGIYVPEEDAEFEIYNEDTNELVTTLKTNEDGKGSVFLKFGNYRLHQISGVEDYKLVNDYFFTINGKHTKEKVFLNNEKIIIETEEEPEKPKTPEESKEEIKEIVEVPDTQINAINMITTITWLSIALGLSYIIYEKNKKSKK